jgi:hypothetical protein
MPNGMIISRHSMYGAVHANYGRPKPNQNPNIVVWVVAQQKNATKQNRKFIVNPLTLKRWTVKNVTIVNK